MGCNDGLVVPRFSKQEIGDTVSGNRLLTMEIEFNSDCNFKCIYCYAENGKKPQEELTTEQFRDVIVQAKDLGVRSMIILGGEPTLYPRLMEMVRFIKAQGMEVEVFTNGARVTPELARELFAEKATVVLKMNTFKKDIQNLMAGSKNAYDQIQTAYKNLRAAGYPTEDRSLGISTVICTHNYDELEGFWRWIRSEGMTPYFEMITPQGRAKGEDMLHVGQEKSEALFRRLSEIDAEFGFKWEPRPPLVGQDCQRHQYSCVVGSTGDVYPCVGVTIPVGNVKNKKLADIIATSEVMKALRNYREHIKGMCRDCEDLSDCYGCRGAAYQLTGDYLASDPLCWKNKENGSGGGCAGCGGRQESASPALPTSAEPFVPHRGKMLLIDRIVSVGDEAEVEAVVSPESIFVDAKGDMEPSAYVELIAQAMAARDGYVNFGGSGNGGREGYLVGAKDLKVHALAHAGDRLGIKIKRLAGLGDEVAVIGGTISRNGTLMAEGEIKVWLKQDEKANPAA